MSSEWQRIGARRVDKRTGTVSVVREETPESGRWEWSIFGATTNPGGVIDRGVSASEGAARDCVARRLGKLPDAGAAS